MNGPRGEGWVRMLTLWLNLKYNPCLICGEPISPLTSTACHEDLPSSGFLKEGAGGRVAGSQQPEIRILLSEAGECAFDAIRISKYLRSNNVMLLHVFSLFFSPVLRCFQL